MALLFLKLLNMSISAGWLVLVVLVLRALLRRAPKWSRCLLWALVRLRLICPVTVKSVLSLMPSGQTLPEKVVDGPSFDVHTGIGLIDRPVNDYLGDRYFEGVTVRAGAGYDTMTILGYIWLIGFGLMILYAVVSWVVLRRKTTASIRVTDNIYLCDDIPTPFILGVIRPRICLPSYLSEEDTAHVVVHERAHLKRGDHLWKPLGFALLSVYWFHPLLWLAYVLLCRDIELACDEAVVGTMTCEDKRAYSAALLSVGSLHFRTMACPLAFGEIGVKERVQAVMNYRKPGVWITLLAVLLCVWAAVSFLTDPQQMTDVWGGTFRVAEVCYQDGRYSFGYLKHYPENAPVFSFAEDQRLFILEDLDSDQRLSAGVFEEIELDGEVLRMCFSPAGDENEIGLELARENRRAWKLLVSPVSGSNAYCLLEQQDGTLYLLQGYYWPEGDETEGQTEYAVRWCFRLEETHVLPGGLSDVICYICQDSPDITQPKLLLSPSGRFQFNYSAFSSYLAVGNFSEASGRLELITDDGKYQYVFYRQEDALIFDAEQSSPLPEYRYSMESDIRESPVPHEAVFLPVPTVFESEDLEQAISQAVLERHASGSDRGELPAESHIVLGTETEGNQVTVYAVAYYSEYRHYDDQLEATSGVVGPVALTFHLTDGAFYELEEYWVPRDGNDYSKDIKARFPDDLSDELFANYTDYISQLAQENLNQAIQLAGAVASSEQMIEGLLADMMESPAEASDPEAYLQTHQETYKMLMEYEFDALRYCFSCFLNGNETGLKGALMSRLCDDIMTTWQEDDNDSRIYETGQDWFHDFQLYAESLLMRYDLESIRKFYPGGYLLLELSGSIE